jgi:hypothetical protein
MRNAPPTLVTRLYQGLLHLYPAGFRAEFGDEMVCDFDDGMFEAWTARGWAGLISVWAFVAIDFVGTLLLQWLRTGVPALIVIAASWSTLCATLVAYQFVPRPEFVRLIPPQNADQEMRVMLVATTAVLMVIVVTIFVAGYFWMYVLGRRRASAPTPGPRWGPRNA